VVKKQMHFCAAALLHQPPCPGALTMGLTGNREKRRHPFLTFCKNDSAGKPCNSQTISPAADPKTFGTLPLQPARGRMTENAGSHSRKKFGGQTSKGSASLSKPEESYIPYTGKPAGNEKAGSAEKKGNGTGETAWNPYFSP
jgi:hypothetical protein